MPDNPDMVLQPPVQYDLAWLLLGCAALVLIGLWYGYIFIVTRKKKPQTVNTLALRQVVPVDIPALQQKYLLLINEVERQYQLHQIDVRGVHQDLSGITRYFVFEVKGIRAQMLTLNDLKSSDLNALSAVIEAYYPSEFAPIAHSTAQKSIEIAREMVTTWR